MYTSSAQILSIILSLPKDLRGIATQDKYKLQGRLLHISYENKNKN